MPEIKLTFWSKKTEDEQWIDVARVVAVMYFPDKKKQEKEREDFVACFVAKFSHQSPKLKNFLSETYATDQQTLIDKLLDALLDAPAFTDLKGRASKNSYNANIAGEILSGIYQFSKTAPQFNIGVKKSCYLLSERPSFIQPCRELSRSSIENFWEKYKGVAHFFGALGFHQGEGRKKRFNFQALQPAKFLDFIAIVKQLEDFATTHIPRHGQKKPLVSKDEIWSINTNFPLLPINLKCSPLPAWAKKALIKYRAA